MKARSIDEVLVKLFLVNTALKINPLDKNNKLSSIINIFAGEIRNLKPGAKINLKEMSLALFRQIPVAVSGSK